MNAVVDDGKKQDDASPRGIVRKWKNELELAERRFQDWWKEADDYYDLYEAQSQQANSYNILWSNTEVLRPALYNSTPTPDVRRRFRDEDPLGKQVSKILQRALDYTVDDYDAEDFDDEMKSSVLDMLITGRGKARVRYMPVFVPMEQAAAPPSPVVPGAPPASPPSAPPRGQDAKDLYVAASGTPTRGRDAKVLYLEADMQEEPAIDDPFEEEPEAPAAEAAPPSPEQIGDESAKCEYVYYKDYMHSAGKKWGEVWWESYRHRLDRDELIQMFGEEIGSKVPLDACEKDERSPDKDQSDEKRTAEVWEIWDKRTREAIFVNKQTEDYPLLQVPDPLQLASFFPGPKPLYAIETTRSLIPIPPYRLYKQQAKELNQVTARIQKIVDALRVRGAYASNIREIESIMKSGDNEMTPIANVTEIASAGGLDKAIWIMPIEKLAMTLQQLYLAREQIKQVIAELTGLSDIVRGSTDPNETKGAQVLKSQWGTLRLQRMQREVQRFARDLIRLLGEIISQKFSPEKLAAITQVKLPTPEEKAQAQMAIQQAQMMAQTMPPQVDPATGAPMPPPGPPPEAMEAMELPTWDDVMQVLQSDELRGYKVDIETDSTVAETIDSDMAGLNEAMQGISTWIQTVGPLVQQGAMSIDAAKEGALVIIRRARMGQAFEDQIESISSMAPPMPPPPQEGTGGGQELQQIMKALQEMSQKGDDLGNGMQNGLQEISTQIQVALENIGRQTQLRAVG